MSEKKGELNYYLTEEEIVVLLDKITTLARIVFHTKGEIIQLETRPLEKDGKGYWSHVAAEVKLIDSKWLDSRYGAISPSEEFIQLVERHFQGYYVQWNNSRSYFSVWKYMEGN